MDFSDKEFFMSSDMWISEDAGDIENYKSLYSAETKEEIKEQGAKAGRLIEEAGRKAALASADDPDEFAFAYRKFRKVIDKCFAYWILCGRFGVLPSAVFPAKYGEEHPEKTSYKFRGRKLSEILSNFSVYAFNDAFMSDIIKSYDVSCGKEFTGYLYTALESKAKGLFRQENTADMFHGGTDSEGRLEVMIRLIRVAESLDIDLSKVKDDELKKIAEKLSTKSWNVSPAYVKDAVTQYNNMHGISYEEYEERIKEKEEGGSCSEDGDSYDIPGGADAPDADNGDFYAEKAAIIRNASASLTEKQRKVFNAKNTLELLSSDVKDILEIARKDFKNSRMSLKELFEDHFDDYIMQEIPVKFREHSQAGWLSLDYEVFSFMIKNRVLPAEKEIAALYGIKPDDFTSTYKAALRKINAFRNK